ncbi:MAG: hypothetical protein J6G98_04075 [Bacilli bacterium]|nr:hypothetical protein [Bacilli bacterium]
MNTRTILLDYGEDSDLFESYTELKLKLIENGYDVKPIINKKNRCSKVTESYIKYDLWELVNSPSNFVKKILWQAKSLNEKKYIVISENSKVLNAFKIYKIDTCMLCRFSKLDYELYSTFSSPKFEKVKEKIKSN